MRRRTAAVLAIIAFALFFRADGSLNVSPQVVRAATTIIVTSTADPGDGNCATNGCTLREAINQAINGDTVSFNIAGPAPHTINLATFAMPVLTSIIVDAQTQPDFVAATGAPVVEILGTGLSPGDSCVTLSALNVTIRGFSIGNCPADGISAGADSAGAVIEGNYIGLRANGSAAPNGQRGIGLAGTSNVTVGGAGATKRNVIGSSGLEGIDIRRTAGSNPDNVRIQGNYIGTNAAGDSVRANGGAGVNILSGTNVVVGVDASGLGSGNVIAGNGGAGVFADQQFVAASINGVSISGNLMGVAANGLNALGGLRGIDMKNGRNFRIGGDTVAKRNVISSHTFEGIRIQSATAQPAGPVTIEGNYIGLGADGIVDLGNGTHGIAVETSGVTIGGDTLSKRNIISGNSGVGIENSAAELVILNNYIGVDAGGTLEKPNNGGGVRLVGGSNNVVGENGQGNVISGNGNDGVFIGSGAGPSTVRGNRIGTTADGLSPRGQGTNGIHIQGASNTTIGGVAPGDGNLISGNGIGNSIGLGNGIFINGGGFNSIVGNRIGTNAAGTAAIGNREAGIRINAGQDVAIGLPNGVDSGNVISGNEGDGILIAPGVTGFSRAYRNRIGTNATGTAAIGNGKNGIRTGSFAVFGDVTNNRQNIVAFNGHNGICIEGGVGTPAHGNAIHSNGRLGIDISNGDDCAGTVLVNDPLDADSGVNGNQNAPVLSGLVVEQFQTLLNVTFNSTPLTPVFSVSLFSSPTCDASGFGEGTHHFATFTVQSNANGNPTVPLLSSYGALPAGDLAMTALLTGNDGTSEFSNCVQGSPPTPTIFSVASPFRVVPPAQAPVIITLNGDIFVDGVSILSVNGIQATSTNVTSSNTLTATVPASAFANPGVARIRVTNGSVHSNDVNLPVCGQTAQTVSGATGVPWCGEPKGNDDITITMSPLITAVFHWLNSGQSFQFWFRGFPPNFNTLTGLFPGEFYFFQSNGVPTIAQNAPNLAFIFSQPGDTFPTVLGARGQIWGGSQLNLLQPNPIDASITAIFSWSNPGQSFNFWFRGFPNGFQTLTALDAGHYYFFQASTANVQVLIP